MSIESEELKLTRFEKYCSCKDCPCFHDGSVCPNICRLIIQCKLSRRAVTLNRFFIGIQTGFDHWSDALVAIAWFVGGQYLFFSFWIICIAFSTIIPACWCFKEGEYAIGIPMSFGFGIIPLLWRVLKHDDGQSAREFRKHSFDMKERTWQTENYLRKAADASNKIREARNRIQKMKMIKLLQPLMDREIVDAASMDQLVHMCETSNTITQMIIQHCCFYRRIQTLKKLMTTLREQQIHQIEKQLKDIEAKYMLDNAPKVNRSDMAKSKALKEELLKFKSKTDEIFLMFQRALRILIIEGHQALFLELADDECFQQRHQKTGIFEYWLYVSLWYSPPLVRRLVSKSESEQVLLWTASFNNVFEPSVENFKKSVQTVIFSRLEVDESSVRIDFQNVNETESSLYIPFEVKVFVNGDFDMPDAALYGLIDDLARIQNDTTSMSIQPRPRKKSCVCCSFEKEEDQDTLYFAKQTPPSKFKSILVKSQDVADSEIRILQYELDQLESESEVFNISLKAQVKATEKHFNNFRDNEDLLKTLTYFKKPAFPTREPDSVISTMENTKDNEYFLAVDEYTIWIRGQLAILDRHLSNIIMQCSIPELYKLWELGLESLPQLFLQLYAIFHGEISGKSFLGISGDTLLTFSLLLSLASNVIVTTQLLGPKGLGLVVSCILYSLLDTISRGGSIILSLSNEQVLIFPIILMCISVLANIYLIFTFFKTRTEMIAAHGSTYVFFLSTIMGFVMLFSATLTLYIVTLSNDDKSIPLERYAIWESIYRSVLSFILLGFARFSNDLLFIIITMVSALVSTFLLANIPHVIQNIPRTTIILDPKGDFQRMKDMIRTQKLELVYHNRGAFLFKLKEHGNDSASKDQVEISSEKRTIIKTTSSSEGFLE